MIIFQSRFFQRNIKTKKEFDRIINQNIDLEGVLSQQESNLKSIGEKLSNAWAMNTQEYVGKSSLKYDNELIVKESERETILSQKNKIHESQFDILLADKTSKYYKLNLG